MHPCQERLPCRALSSHGHMWSHSPPNTAEPEQSPRRTRASPSPASTAHSGLQQLHEAEPKRSLPIALLPPVQVPPRTPKHEPKRDTVLQRQPTDDKEQDISAEPFGWGTATQPPSPSARPARGNPARRMRTARRSHPHRHGRVRAGPGNHAGATAQRFSAHAYDLAHARRSSAPPRHG